MPEGYTLVVIGGGRMGEAIAAGLVSSGALDASAIAVAEPSPERREVFERHGIIAVSDAHSVVKHAEIVLFAVKPQVIDAVIAHLADDLTSDTLVVSIAAGITTARIESLLAERSAVVRVMPNTPALVGSGMAVVSGGSYASGGQVERVRSLFEAVGDAVVIDELVQDAATAISGSGPAYFARFVELLVAAGVEQGLSDAVARRLAIQTMRGTSELLEVTGMHPRALIEGVSSPGGTTVAALEALEAGGIASAIPAAVAANIKRAKELGS